MASVVGASFGASVFLAVSLGAFASALAAFGFTVFGFDALAAVFLAGFLGASSFGAFPALFNAFWSLDLSLAAFCFLMTPFEAVLSMVCKVACTRASFSAVFSSMAALAVLIAVFILVLKPRFLAWFLRFVLIAFNADFVFAICVIL